MQASKGKPMKHYMTKTRGTHTNGLLLGLVQVPYEKALVDFPGKEHSRRLSQAEYAGPGAVARDGAACSGTHRVSRLRCRSTAGKVAAVEAGDMAEVMQWLAPLPPTEIQFGLQ